MGEKNQRSIMPNCEICGEPILKYIRPSKPHKTCGKDSCRLEMRRRVGRQSAEKKRSNSILRQCLKCGHEFRAFTKFTRICQGCKDKFAANPNYADNWGA